MAGGQAETARQEEDLNRFARFAAIDWSGAKGSRHKGIAVAVAEAGDAPPRLVRPGHVWSRTEVLDWIAALAGGPPTLVGMDFSFAPPFVARGAYLPGDATPDAARALADESVAAVNALYAAAHAKGWQEPDVIDRCTHGSPA